MIQGCVKHRRQAQADFYDLFARCVYDTAYRMLGCVEEAEDVMQEILLRTLTNPVLLVHDREGMAKRLRRMTINESIDRLRKQHVIWEDLDVRADTGDEQEQDELLMKAERSELLRHAIESLPVQGRTVLQLAVIEEMNYDEIASLLHITNSCVRAHLTRAKNKLINYFGNEKRKK